MQAQAHARLADLREQEEERLAACIDRQNKEQLLCAKSSQKLREQSAELRKLRQQIETAAVVMGRELQLQEKQMLAEREQAYNNAIDAMLAEERAKVSWQRKCNMKGLSTADYVCLGHDLPAELIFSQLPRL